MRSCIDPTDSLYLVPADPNRRYDDKCAEHARKELQRFQEELGSQQAAATALGINQGTLSRALDLSSQPSLRIIIALARATHRSVDEILGLETDADRIARIVRRELERHRALQPTPTPSSAIRKKGG